jgi:tetratricopeptide (TPR) repeat protein
MFALLPVCFFLQALTPEVIEHAQAGAAAQKAGQFDVAIREFSKVTDLQPNSASGHANLGDAYFQSGDYPSAIPELEKALSLNPKLMGTHQTLGVALLVEGNAAAALSHLELTHTPELLGLAYLETGRLGSAIMALQAALGRQPDDADLLYYYGQATALAAQKTSRQLARIDAGHAPEAQRQQRPIRDVAVLQTELAKSPNDPDLLYDFQRAAKLASSQAFDKILHNDQASARAHQILAERAAASGRLPEAEKEYAESLKLKPFTAGVHLALGNVLAEEGKYAAALTEFRTEVQLRPADVAALYRLGSALLQQGQANQALVTFQYANQVRPDTPEILLALGNAASANKDDASAQKYWLKLLTIDQTSTAAAQAHLGLANLYRSAGKKLDADNELAAYQKLTTKRIN